MLNTVVCVRHRKRNNSLSTEHAWFGVKQLQSNAPGSLSLHLSSPGQTAALEEQKAEKHQGTHQLTRWTLLRHRDPLSSQYM